MLAILADRTYRHLFLAQIIALVGTGLATVALGLLAFDLAGADAGQVLGTALAIKMIAYVSIAPVAAAVAERVPRRAMLVSLDLVRGAIAVLLPFVTEIWQVYLLIFLLQSASAAFTPTFQATIPEVLTDEAAYTRALSLSRLAYDLESLVSPLLAALLLTWISFHDLFAGTVVGFLASAALVVSVRLPARRPAVPRSIYDRTTRGLRIYLATPRLRGLLAVSFAAATGGAMVLVNTIVIVQGSLALPQTATALALAAYGGGSMLAALVLPRLLQRRADREVMLAAVLLTIGGLVAGMLVRQYALLLPLWFLLGLAYSAAQTPAGRLLRKSVRPEDLPAIFAAQFALAHACWLVTYPLAGWLGSVAGLPATFAVLALLALLALLAAQRIWPRHEPVALAHEHPGLADADPHWQEGTDRQGPRHSHAYVIDSQHTAWPPRR